MTCLLCRVELCGMQSFMKNKFITKEEVHMGYKGMNPFDYTYTSRRNITYGKQGMVAASQPQASQAGLEILKKGGNAVDAAIAMAIALTVVEPTSNGVGGDAFALIWTKDGLKGLNASGPAGSLADAEKMKSENYTKMPEYGIKTVTVPGAPSAWVTLSKTYGKLPFKELFKPAISLAEEGYVVSPMVSEMWEYEFNVHNKQHREQPEYKAWFDTYMPMGRAMRAGEVFKNPDLGKTLRELADTECESFYRGAIAGKIIDFCAKYDGFLTKEDLATYYPEWVEPISINYRGYDVWEIPPNGHGIVALMALNMLKGYDLKEKENVDTYHKSIEALKLAYTDGKKYVTDIRHMSVKVEDLLSDEYANKRRDLINKEALMPEAGNPKKGGTVYLCVADGDGNMVSYIQSNYWKFGSGLVIPGTSIALHNRGREFSLNKEDDNYLLPGKKPYHTIIPGFLTKDGKPVGPFGVMGGYMQPQGHVQVVENMIDFHMNPQQALDAPRWQWIGGKKILVEYNFPIETYQKLQEMGHEIKYSNSIGSFGRGQIIIRQEDGILVGGTEPRTDGAVLGY